ncbi:MAG TPA: hypothetical protein VHF24_08425 [Acidimicrobiales bacterium]|nr:hypothetical protein [Acidimicrobiales bacterium]
MRFTAKTTAILWGAGGVGWVANAALGLDAADGTGGFYVTELAWLPVHALVLGGLLGLDRLGVVGDSTWGKAGLRLAILGRVVFLAAEGVAIAVGNDEIPLFPLAAVTTALGMMAAGAAIIGARRLTGWQRYLPITVGAYPFIFMFPVLAVTGERPDLGVTGWGVTFIGVAAAMWTAATRGSRRSESFSGATSRRSSAWLSA